MRTSSLSWVLTLLVAGQFAGACDAKKSEPASAPVVALPRVAPPPPPSPPPTAAPNLDACPSAVIGARTRMRDVKDGIEITVVAKKSNAVAEIRARASKLTSAPQIIPLSGLSPAASCLVAYFPGAEDAVEPVKGGIRLTITSENAEMVARVRKVARDRAEAIAGASSKRAGAPEGKTTAKKAST